MDEYTIKLKEAETSYSLVKKAICEGIGTALLVFIACGVAVTTANMIATAICFGAAICIIACIIGNISGCHINPAISIAMYLNKRLTLKEFLWYICAQFIGATIGALLLYLIVRLNIWWTAPIINLAQNEWTSQYTGNKWYMSMIASFFLEIIMTFIFVSVVLISTQWKNNILTPITIGIALMAMIFIGFNIDGTSVNPARSFGPALILAIFNETTPLFEYWVYLVAPLIGGISAAYANKYFFGK